MITRFDIGDRASQWQLRHDVVEKDYVLGWLLAAIGRHPHTAEHWVFKGGTCLKKCYFETYRFSEDLDFTLLPGAIYDTDGLRGLLVEIAAEASELSGIEFPQELVDVRAREDRLKRPAFGCKLGYRGPLAIHTPPRVVFDLTAHEPLVESAVVRQVHHAYPDAPTEPIVVRAYPLNELFAEKLRALVERTRPRDLYDVVNILTNAIDELDLEAVRRVFAAKCRAKQFEPPDVAGILDIVNREAELVSEWQNMLAHQLPELPPLDLLRSRLPDLLAVLERSAPAPARLPSAARGTDTEVIRPAGVTYWPVAQPLELVRYAGANHLLVAFDYHEKPRLVEPYSFRMPGTGNLLLYGREQASQQVKAFKVDEIENLRATTTPFTPRFQIELTSIMPLRSGEASLPGAAPRRTRPRSAPQRAGGLGLTYVFECPVCTKRFKRAKNSARLNPHERKDGWGDCPGRTGFLVEVK